MIVWLTSRAVLMLVVTVVGVVRGMPRPTLVHEPGGRWLELFTWFDSEHYLSIARSGYSQACCEQAFFPGYPLLIRVLTPLSGGRPALVGLLLSVIASAVAAVLLHRLASEWAGGGRAGRRAGLVAVVLLAAHPEAGFLTSVYGESVFLACALGAWLAARHDRWWLAGGLAALACSVRVNGLFLLAGIAVMYAVRLRRERRWLPHADVLALGAGGVVVLAFVTYLYRVTGVWNSWSQAQVEGWHRHVDWPWAAVLNVTWMVRHRDGAASPWPLTQTLVELGVVLAGVPVCAWLVYRRHWPEAVYLGLGLMSLLCSDQVTSAVRYSLAWFPVLFLLSAAAARPRGRWLCAAVVVVGVPLELLTSIAFSTHQFVG